MESIQNLAVAPVNIQADICGKGRKHQPSESDIEEDTADSQGSDSPGAKGPKQPLLTRPAAVDGAHSGVGGPLAASAAKMAADEARGKGKRKKGRGSQNSEQPAEKPPLAKVVPPQGGPFLPLSAQPASTQPPRTPRPNTLRPINRLNSRRSNPARRNSPRPPCVRALRHRRPNPRSPFGGWWRRARRPCRRPP